MNAVFHPEPILKLRGALPVLRPFIELPQSMGVLRACPQDLAEVAQPEKSGAHSHLARISTTSSAASVTTATFVPSLETGASAGEFGLRNRVHQRARSGLVQRS